MVQNKNPHTKISKLRNPITDYSARDLVRSRQDGFIPMIVLLVIVLGVLIWFAYHHVSTSNKNKALHSLQQNENLINR